MTSNRIRLVVGSPLLRFGVLRDESYWAHNFDQFQWVTHDPRGSLLSSPFAFNGLGTAGLAFVVCPPKAPARQPSLG